MVFAGCQVQLHIKISVAWNPVILMLSAIQFKNWQVSCGKETRHCIVRGNVQSEWNCLAVRMTLKANGGASACQVMQKKKIRGSLIVRHIENPSSPCSLVVSDYWSSTLSYIAVFETRNSLNFYGPRILLL